MSDGTSTADETAEITRAIPELELLSDDALDAIEAAADTILQEVGVNFVNNPEALERWRRAGAEIEGERVRLPRGLARELCATAPGVFTQLARNPARSVEIGGRGLVLAPVYGPPFVHDAGRGRRYATIEDFRNFVKLGQMARWLHHSGGTVCEPTDLPVNKRHLDMLHAHMTLSDKPFMGTATEPSRARDCIEMCGILFGEDVVREKTVMTSLITIGSPLTFDDTMTGALEIYAAHNQSCILAPFAVVGATTPGSVAGTLAQLLAEVLAGAAYAQLVRKGAPVIFGPFVTTMDRHGGGTGFGTPAASQITYGAGQLARRLGLPYRAGGALTGARLPDAQAAYESAASLNDGLLSGANFMLHACGWLEGGLVSSYEKFVMDADRLGVLHGFASGVEAGLDDALDALREVGPGGHFLGREPEMAGAWQSDIFDNRLFEAWIEDGGRDAMKLATERVRDLLESYEPPALDPAIDEALSAFVAAKKAEMPDSFM